MMKWDSIYKWMICFEKMQWKSCQWCDIRTVHLHGCYQMRAVCYKFTVALMGTATMNAMYYISVFLLLPMDILCSRCIWSRSRNKLGTRTSMCKIGICDMMAHVRSITCKIWFWIRHKFNVNKNPTDATVCRYLFTAKLRSPDQTKLEGSSGTSSMTCTRGCGYSF